MTDANRIEYALVAWLLTKSYVTDLVVDRVQPPPLPSPPTLPAIGYRRTGNVPAMDMQGFAGQEAVRIEWTSWGGTPEAAADTAEALRNALNGLVGQTLSSALGDFWVQSAVLEGDRDVTFDSPALAQQRMYGLRADLRIAYTQTQPTH